LQWALETGRLSAMRILVISLFLVGCATTPKNHGHTDTTFSNVQYVDNYDGDTITFNIPGVHPLLGKNAKIRVSGVDTPEIRTKDRCEKALALKAKKIVGNALTNAKRIDLANVERGKYFRIVADVRYDGSDLKQLLQDRKLSRAYEGGTKSKASWDCSQFEK
jgi:micrococcal nuclease